MERRFTASDGTTIYYGDSGERDGVPIAFCHGIAVSSVQFTDDAEYFAGLGYRVLTPDLRGHGKSSRPPVHKRGYRLERLALDQAEMLDDAGIGQIHWIGNSLGGITGLAMLKYHAQRLSSLTTFGTAYALQMPRADVDKFFAFNFKLFKPLVVKTAAYLCSKDDGTRRRIEEMAMASDTKAVSAVASSLLGYDFMDEALASRLPTLLMRLGNDNLMNWALGRTLKLAEGRPNLEMIELVNGGHCANLDDNAHWRAALLKFLQPFRPALPVR
ncbi:MAG: alpha/beta hydrolase [Devosia sp.]